MALKNCFLLFLCVSIALAIILQQPMAVSAQQDIPTPSQLIDAVNSLRLAYGLPPLAVHSVLMQVGQIEADGIANGAGGHWRPNGLSLGQWLISLGYPLSGDLSLDGYRSENWTPCQSAQGAVEAWLGDDIHTNTMLSTNRSDIGAGVAVASGGEIYCVLETALRTNSGRQQSDASAILTGVPQTQVASTGGTLQAAANQSSEYIYPVKASTAMPNGDVFHTVQFGQSLWSIAIKYNTKIKYIQALNNLGNDFVVYEGQKLLVMKGATQPPPATTTPVTIPTGTPPASATYAMPTIEFPPTATLEPTQQPQDVNKSNPSSSRFLVVMLIVASFVGGGMAVWLIRDPNSG